MRSLSISDNLQFHLLNAILNAKSTQIFSGSRILLRPFYHPAFAKRSNYMHSPNILLITSDQQHYNTLGICNPEIHTPNLDRLAREGTLFNRAYCSNPTCTPSRASIITGLYPSQHGAWSLGTKLPEQVPALGGLSSESRIPDGSHWESPLSAQSLHSLLFFIGS